jgi:hypothetical protein
MVPCHHHPIVLAIMRKKGPKKPDVDVHLPGGALQTTFAVDLAVDGTFDKI